MSRPSSLALVAAALALTAAGPAVGQDSKAEAAQRFKEGEKAFKRHEYAVAAKAFEEAHAIAPHPAALFNAATAHQKAGDLVRAANLCARYLRDAPEDDARREKANALIGELMPKLGRIQIKDRGAKNVQLDGKALDAETTYVDPGDHTVSGEFGDKTVQRKLSVVAGSLVKVALDPPQRESAALEEEGDSPAPTNEPDQAKNGDKGLSPTLFYVGLGVTAVVGGVTLWSGLDTNKARDEYDAEPTPEGLDEGRAKQSRTNLLLGATAVVGVGTAVVGLFLTNWKGKPKAAPPPEDAGLLVGPGFVGARGRF
ncbi:MAG: hypothetical protein IT377_29600 [Polyangiaceae bacterium]|nr:hypothetical protein [Polyangiaceae bacterium]